MIPHLHQSTVQYIHDTHTTKLTVNEATSFLQRWNQWELFTPHQ